MLKILKSKEFKNLCKSYDLILDKSKNNRDLKSSIYHPGDPDNNQDEIDEFNKGMDKGGLNEDWAMYQRGLQKKNGTIAGAITSLISDKSRVYKGASWKDRAYWLDPAQRRFYHQDQATDFIGFRCVMSRLGGKSLDMKKRSRN